MTTIANPRRATLYRMVMDKHVCPYGLKAKDLLQREGYTVDDRWLTTREETDAFKAENGVRTTPQTFIGGERIGGAIRGPEQIVIEEHGGEALDVLELEQRQHRHAEPDEPLARP